MKRISLLAMGAVVSLSACGLPETPSRLDNRDTLYSGFETVDAYTPQVAGARASNDFMRFSTMSMVE